MDSELIRNSNCNARRIGSAFFRTTYSPSLCRASARGHFLPMLLNHRRCHVGGIAERRSAARPGVSTSTATSAAIARRIIRTRTRFPGGVVLITAGLNDDCCDGRSGQRSVDLALVVRW